MEQEIKQLIELDLVANKLKEECEKKYETQVKINNQEIDRLKLFKEKEIQKAIEDLETICKKEIDERITVQHKERQKAVQETTAKLEKSEDNIVNFLMFNITQEFSSIK